MGIAQSLVNNMYEEPKRTNLGFNLQNLMFESTAYNQETNNSNRNTEKKYYMKVSIQAIFNIVAISKNDISAWYAMWLCGAPYTCKSLIGEVEGAVM